MSWQDDLSVLAREREAVYETSLSQLVLDEPSKLLRQLRQYLKEQTNRRKLKRTYEQPRLKEDKAEFKELMCEEIEFESDARLSFRIQLRWKQTGWFVTQFKFDLHLPGRKVNMIRIHLNPAPWHDPLSVPRCHLHIGDSGAHIPFPIMDPRLILHFICENVEPDLKL